MSRARTGSALFWGGMVILLGYGVMKVATPTDEQFYKALSPDLRRKVDEQRAGQARKDQYEKIKAAGEAGEVIFQDSASGLSVTPSERRQR